MGLRGTGIGKALMQIVEHVGRKVGVRMSMLTVFTANTHAETFYRRLGYVEDASSPQARKLRGGKVKRPEYLILSKTLLLEEKNETTKRLKSS
jgi:ribosomal protein S18 acetylase RimI-like enzyme